MSGSPPARSHDQPDVEPAHEILTRRLRLRGWCWQDASAMEEINTDEEVRRYLNRPVDRNAVEGFIGAVLDHWHAHGFGCFALDSREPGLEGRLVGFVGVAYPTFLPALAQRPELGWRLARGAWGRGLATEAAIAARDDAFSRLGLGELISIIHPDNERSRSVATKLGMTIERQVFNPVLERHVDVWHSDRARWAPQARLP